MARRNPDGWTDKGMARGWRRRVPTPQDAELKALRKRNADLERRLAQQEAALQALMARVDKGNGE